MLNLESSLLGSLTEVAARVQYEINTFHVPLLSCPFSSIITSLHWRPLRRKILVLLPSSFGPGDCTIPQLRSKVPISSWRCNHVCPCGTKQRKGFPICVSVTSR